MRHFLKGKRIAIDTETTGLDVWHGDQPFAFGFCNERGDTWYCEWGVDPWTRIVVPKQKELKQIKALCADESVAKVFHNAKYDVRIMDNAFGIKTRGTVEDTMFMAHVCNSMEHNFKLKDLAAKYLDYPKEDEKELKDLVKKLRRKAKKLGWLIGCNYKPQVDGTWKEDSAVEADYWLPRAFDSKDKTCGTYCRGDVERTMLLYHCYTEGIKHYKMERTYQREVDLWPVTYSMETRGVRVKDSEIEIGVDYMRAEALKQMATLEGYAEGEINVDSPAQLGKLFFGKLGLPVKRYTKTGKPQTNIDALHEHLSHPAVESLFRYRAAKNGMTNFFMKYKKLKMRDPLNEGGFAIHPNLRQVGPVTGRFSCREPNLQNVANALTTRSPMPIQARTPFGPRPGYAWYHIDYSQVEVRVFADVAQETSMLQAMKEGLDIHTFSTNKAWGGEGRPAMERAAMHALELDGTGDSSRVNAEVEKVWKVEGITAKNLRAMSEGDKLAIANDWMKQFDFDIVKAEKSVAKKTSRAKAKMVVFLKVYGGGPDALAGLLGSTRREAKVFLNDYDDAFPRISEYMNELTAQARRDGHIINRFGRRLVVLRDKAYRSVNYMVQGSCADLLKEKMITTHDYLGGTGLDAHLVLCVHDELIFEFLKEHAYRSVLQNLCRLMEDHGGAFGVPTPVEIEKVVDSWNVKSKATIGGGW